MKRKILLLFVSLVLLVYCIPSAIAEEVETITTITVQPGSLLDEYPELKQITDLAAIRFHSMSDNYGAIVLSLSDIDAVQVKMKGTDDGLYLQSDMLGQQPLYFTWDALNEYITEYLEENADFEMVDTPYDMKTMEAMMDGTMTDEQMLEMMGIDNDVVEYITALIESVDVQSGSFTLNGSDEATEKSVFTMTGDDLNTALDLSFVQNMLIEQLTTEYPEASEEELQSSIDMQTEQIKQAVDSLDITVTSTSYTVDDNFIAFELLMDAVMENYDGSITPIGINIQATKTSIDSAAFYRFSVVLIEGEEEFVNQEGSLYIGDTFITGSYTLYASPDEPIMEAVLNVDLSQPNTMYGELSFSIIDTYYGETQSVLFVFEQAKADAVTNTEVKVFVGGEVDDIKNALGETDLITLNFSYEELEESDFFADLENATPETSVQLLQMSDEELDVYMQGMEQNLLVTMLTVIDNLPADISEALMQGFSGF